MTAIDVFALVLEVLTWVGIVPGVVLLIVGYTRQAFSSRFEHTWGIVIASPAGTAVPWVRWMDRDRELRRAPLPTDHPEDLTVGDEIEVYFDSRNAQNARLDDPTGDGRLFRVLGWVLVGVGALAAVAQLVLLLVE